MSDKFDTKAQQLVDDLEQVAKQRVARPILELRGKLARAIADGMRKADMLLRKLAGDDKKDEDPKP